MDENSELMRKIYDKLKTFQLNELNDFLTNNYWTVKNKITPGMERGQWENLLVEHCMLKGELPGLYERLESFST